MPKGYILLLSREISIGLIIVGWSSTFFFSILSGQSTGKKEGGGLRNSQLALKFSQNLGKMSVDLISLSPSLAEMI